MIRREARKWEEIFLFLVVVGLCWAGLACQVLAQDPIEENAACLTCHSNPDSQIQFADGSTAEAHVSGGRYLASVHGQQGMTCAGCHPGHEEYPHAPVKTADHRSYTLELNQTCLECHPDQGERVGDSVHALAMSQGRPEAAVCVDCHGAHDTASLGEARVRIAATCRQCHSMIYDEYNSSIHGSALREENNTDVPTCVDCHGVHSMEDPRTAEFRLNSPNLCGSCHADEALMSQYDISTDVFETYVADFHGTTVTLFEKQSPDAATNKAVCYDCHGVHNIRAIDDPEGAVIKENLLVTCQKCHPDATTNFPESWTSHFPQTFEKQPLVSSVNLFYAIIIPGVLGFMGVFVVIDAGRRLVDRGKHDSPPGGPQQADNTATDRANKEQEGQNE